MHTLWLSIFTARGNTFAIIATLVITEMESQLWLTALWIFWRQHLQIFLDCLRDRSLPR